MGKSVTNPAAKKAAPADAKRTAADALSRLPRSAREEISIAIEDGATWREVAAIAAKHGLAGVTAQNVSNYRHGAHKRWLAARERMDAIRRDSEATAAIVRHYAAEGGSPADAGLLAASEILSSALAGLGPESVRMLIAEDPKALFAITRELARVSSLISARKAEVEPEAGQTPPAESDEERAARIRRIFGLPE